MSWPRLMRIDTPFREGWTQVFKEKWNVVFGAPGAVRVTSLVTLRSTRWIQIGAHVNRTGGRGRFLSRKVEHWDCLGLKKTHYLKYNTE